MTYCVRVVGREEENIDYLKELEEELEQAEYDVFEVEDVTEPQRAFRC